MVDIKGRMERLLNLRKEIDRLEKQFNDIKEEIINEMIQSSEHHLKVEGVGEVKFTPQSENRTIDLVQLKKSEPSLYQELFADYPKTTVRKEYYSVTFEKKALKEEKRR